MRDSNPSHEPGGLRTRWLSGGTTVGTFCMIPSALSAGIVGRAGFDWACVDTQHGVIGRELLGQMLAALAATDTPGLVRTLGNDPGEIGAALDAGAVGVIIPMIGSEDEARAAVDASRYAPAGTRSWARSTPAGLGHPDYTPRGVNHATLVVVQIETKGAVEQLDAILSVEGIDGVFVGPGDLAVSLGLDPHDENSPALQATIATILETCVRSGVIAGIACSSPEAAVEWQSRGFTALSVQHDVSYLTQAVRRAREATIRAAVGAPKPA